MNNSNLTRSNRASGFSMVEVLISVFILAIGLLGLLNLQMTSLKNNHSAQLRTTATVLAYDMLERIRANKTADYALTMSATPSGATTKDADLVEWISEISSALPSGDGSISYSGNIITVTIQWDDSRGTGGSTKQSFSVSSES